MDEFLSLFLVSFSNFVNPPLFKPLIPFVAIALFFHPKASYLKLAFSVPTRSCTECSMNQEQSTLENYPNLKKGCESGFPYFVKSSPISQSFLFEELRCLILASSLRKLCGHIEFFKFDITIKKKILIKIRLKFKGLDRFSQNLLSNITQY